MRIKTALVSVSDKTGLAEFAKELEKGGVKLVSTGGTFEFLRKAGLHPTKAEDLTGFPEMLDGRVKTLHPKLHAGILAKRNKEHLAQLEKHGIGTIDLVVVNLYPFKETIVQKGATLEEAIENIDIGGPSLIRGAAKNHESVGVVVSPSQYARVLEDLARNKFELSEKTRKELCVEAFGHTAVYDATISEYLGCKYGTEKFPPKLAIGLEKLSTLRYGENPHQKAAVYSSTVKSGGIPRAQQLNGKELSYNNYLDADAAISITREFEEPCAAIVKHNSPCGVAVSKKTWEALAKAYACDKLSAFGGIIALNRECDGETARLATSFFNEVIVAPSYSGEALAELRKKQNLRVLALPNAFGMENDGVEFRQVTGGMLAQERDSMKEQKWVKAAGPKAKANTMKDLEFAWKTAKHVKSNAIVVAKGLASVGIGGGLTSRVDAVELALRKAGVMARGACMASDAFFPFKDSIELASKAGVIAIAEPGGSVKDAEVIGEAEKRGISIYFTGERHFRH